MKCLKNVVNREHNLRKLEIIAYFSKYLFALTKKVECSFMRRKYSTMVTVLSV